MSDGATDAPAAGAATRPQRPEPAPRRPEPVEGRAADTRHQIAAARRVVVKVGSSSLTSPDGRLDLDRVARLVDALAGVRQQGREVVLVSSGAIAAGLAPLGLRRRPRDLATQQAAAAVGQGLLVEQYMQRFARHRITVGQVLLTVEDVTVQSKYRNAYRTAAKLLELGVLPIVNENDTVATKEIRFGDNDRLAALVAHLVHAEALVLLSDVPALYTAHPETPGAERVRDVVDVGALTGIDISRRGSAVGTGGMVTKLEAARIATSAGIPALLGAADDAAAALAGQDVGTAFAATGRRRPTRLLWLAHVSDAQGSLVLDAGAVQAVTQRKASLLPAGITDVHGSFTAGEPVDLVGPDGAVVARGLVSYDAADLPQMIGQRTGDLVEERGAEYARVVVHRDALVVL
ncbi:glutamate 5-kinase [Desertihabitans brevis]|uniref:Glutamate 5-kinase n=1 Tax=Desertihabitans brevis TaxID=2268447 RepID=A0A367YQJ0_9ACTN|nr:glutamate 5-kinase [Desertihabitans brevis]RCK68104.1 glutamate 5-kinase [Desertihabitans brevis]